MTEGFNSAVGSKVEILTLLKAEVGTSEASAPMSRRWYKTEGERRLAYHLIRWFEIDLYGEPRTALPSSHHA